MNDELEAGGLAPNAGQIFNRFRPQRRCTVRVAVITLVGKNNCREPLIVPDSAKILILNGPNLNLLGIREPEIYGRETLADIEECCARRAKELNLEIDFLQSNSEGDCVGAIQKAADGCAGIIINPAAYTHTSVAIMDALKLVSCPVIEVHLSNIFARESFRHHSYVSPVANGIVCGFGGLGYNLALDAMAQLVKEKKER